MNKDYRHHNFKSSKINNKRLFLFIGIGILVVALIIFLIFFIRSETAEPGIKMVSGTEYISGEEGQVIVRLEDTRNTPIEDAECIMSLLYPDKSFFLIDVPMIPTSVPGNYYYSFTTPQTPGIYEEHIRCTVVRNNEPRTLNISYSFHVSPGLNLIVEMSQSQRAQYDDLVAKINALDANVRAQINSVDMRVYSMQTFIDNNVMGEVGNLKQDVKDINISLNDSVSGIEGRLNATMINNFEELYSRFRASYDAMSNIFGGE